MIKKIIFLLLLVSSGVGAVLPARYMQTTQDAAIWGKIGDKMVTVGNIRAGQIIAVEPNCRKIIIAFNFGFGYRVISIKGISSLFRGDKKLKTVWGTSTSR